MIGKINWLIDKFNGTLGKVPGVPDVGKLGLIGDDSKPDKRKKMPGAANGGIVRQAGGVLVGERGPELLRLPKAARVDPLPVPAAVAGGGMLDVTVTTPVYLDGREIATIVNQHNADDAARGRRRPRGA